MSRVPFKYCALHYLNQWLAHDRRYCEALAGNDKPEKLEALKKAAAFYRVSRNLWEEHDVGKGLLRYEPLLNVLDSQTSDNFHGDQLVPAVLRVRDQISAEYGERDVLSLTTKFLWLRVKSPIIIYDSRARNAVSTKPGDLRRYYAKWQQMFSESVNEINLACDSLQHVWEYSIDPGVGTSSHVRDVSSQRWFRERVFDIYLWHNGGK